MIEVHLSFVFVVLMNLVQVHDAHAFPYMFPRFYSSYRNYNFNQQDAFTYINKLERRLQALESQVENSISSRLGDVELVVTDLAHQQCQTNEVDIRICPQFADATTEKVLSCVLQPIAGAGPVNITRDIVFVPPFLSRPVVTMGFSSQAFLSAKNCSTRVLSVTATGFTFNFLANNYLPVQVTLTWFACPSALLQPGHGLTGTLPAQALGQP